MSLTNPKNVVTEKRLSEFYGEILPYLGGMPEVLANKFSKSDLYSTDEKIVGCWTNGKPLYQKTFIDTSSFSVGTTYVYKDIGDLTGLNVEDIVSINGTGGYASDAGRYPLPLSFTDTKNVCIDCFILNGTNVRIRGRRSEGTAVYANFIVTIQYTKTTDAANSFKYGNETDYSTDEKIVGTWINGKPLYQKTVEIPANKIPNNNSTTIDIGTTNVAEIVDCKGILRTKASVTEYSWTPIPRIQENQTTQNIAIDVNSSANAIYLKGRNFDFTQVFDKGYVTIQYTKTTD